MKSQFIHTGSGRLESLAATRRRAAAFSLVEILVVMGLLSIIVLGLIAMFTQTQRAFRTGLTQTDVLASGRLSMDLVTREIEQITPAYQFPRDNANNTNLNFFAQIAPGTFTPARLSLPGSTFSRDNTLQDTFFVYKENRDWVGVGYMVRTTNVLTGNFEVPAQGVGTLYRMETRVPMFNGNFSDLFFRFGLARQLKPRFPSSRIVDGVVAFQVSPFDASGGLVEDTTNAPSGLIAINARLDIPRIDGRSALREIAFYSNTVPGAVEVELGILEDRAWKHYDALPTPVARANYLTNLAGRVHVFRQRVPVRNVDRAAYLPLP